MRASVHLVKWEKVFPQWKSHDQKSPNRAENLSP